jgi:alpha-D-xyloside xylohydrolase
MKSDKIAKTLSRREFSGFALSSVVPLVAELAVPSAGTDARLQTREATGSSASVSGFELLYPGIWKVTLGVPEKFSPVKLRFRKPADQALRKMPAPLQCPIPSSQIRAEQMDRGFVLNIPLGAGEQVYGFGLQFLSFQQRKGKKVVRTNADPRVNSGDTNAPVPFYVTTGGYGVLIDSSRYVSFYIGRESRRDVARIKFSQGQPPQSEARSGQGLEPPSEVIVEIPAQRGADIYIFGGPAMLQAVERYNLFSGGGCLPPRWGLGLWYRCDSNYSAKQVQDLAEEFRQDDMPCDVIGLEPGWQTHAYSCTFVWNPERFPDPADMIRNLVKKNFHLNLWEHAFTNPSSPLHEPLKPQAGNFEVWEGLVPDFLKPEARKTFADFHEKEHIRIGVSGFKLDECDNSDFTGGWSFPECSRFPSGLDGEQMHSHFGLAYQETIEGIFRRRNTRTYQLVRSTNALAAPFAFALYSDLYDHRQYIRAIVNSGFSGLLWAAEVRNANDAEDMIRRLQTACFSALMQIDAWYLMNPPWKQVNREANNAGKFAPDWQKLQAQCREIIRMRMQLVPYLYSSFVRYHERGTPPFRSLVMDYPTDPQVWKIDDQFMVGENLMVAPVIAGETSRKIYLPEGGWVNFWTGKPVAAGHTVTMQVPLDIIPVFVKSGTLLPLARPSLHAGAPDARQVTVRVYGKGDRAFTLYEDDDSTLAVLRGKYNQVVLTWDDSNEKGRVERIGRGDYPRYKIAGWERV